MQILQEIGIEMKQTTQTRQGHVMGILYRMLDARLFGNLSYKERYVFRRQSQNTQDYHMH